MTPADGHGGSDTCFGHHPLKVGDIVRRKRVTWFQRVFMGETAGPFKVKAVSFCWADEEMGGVWSPVILSTEPYTDWCSAEGYEVVL